MFRNWFPLNDSLKEGTLKETESGHFFEKQIFKKDAMTLKYRKK